MKDTTKDLLIVALAAVFVAVSLAYCAPPAAAAISPPSGADDVEFGQSGVELPPAHDGAPSGFYTPFDPSECAYSILSLPDGARLFQMECFRYSPANRTPVKK